MKKILVIILVVAVSMCFVACSSVSSATNEPEDLKVYEKETRGRFYCIDN